VAIVPAPAREWNRDTSLSGLRGDGVELGGRGPQCLFLNLETAGQPASVRIAKFAEAFGERSR